MFTPLFDDWIIQKKELHSEALVRIEQKEKYGDKTKHEKYPQFREVWWCYCGANVGSEIQGKTNFLRPVLIVKKIGSMYFCIPLTSQDKWDSRWHFALSRPIGKVEKPFVILSHGHTLDKARFTHNLGTISKQDFKDIQKILKHMYFVSEDDI
jgi:mRNA-degrading endonuclease toxin of MazEF toxin-antitoxin module